MIGWDKERSFGLDRKQSFKDPGASSEIGARILREILMSFWP